MRINKTFNECDYIFAPSQFVIHSCEKFGIPKNKIFLIKYGVDTKKFIPKKNQKIIFIQGFICR